MFGARVLGSIAALVFASGLAACGSESEEARTPDVAAQDADGQEVTPGAEDEEVAVIQVKDHGVIKLELYPNRAPNHVENFKKLARDHFYDGMTFHRVIPGFMIQTGDPNTKDPDTSRWGMGGPGYTIDAEFNKAPHLRGTVSMARTEDPNSAGSQFFICIDRASHLDGNYTVFGKVFEGMDVADEIANAPRDRNDRPLENLVVESVRIESPS